MSKNDTKAVKEVAYLAEVGYAITLEPDMWRQCCEDDSNLVEFFVDVVMMSTRNKADATVVREVFKALRRVKSPNWK